MKLLGIFAALTAVLCLASAGYIKRGWYGGSGWSGRSGWSSGWSSPVVVRRVVYSSPSYGGWSGFGGGYGGSSRGYGGGYGGYGGYGSGWKSGWSSGWW